MARPRVLITGFGPFPGVSENPSGWLAKTLAAGLPANAWELHSAVLPTEWDAVATLAPRLHESLQPHVMIHFGVSARAKGLQIERAAHNGAEPRADACGARPPCSTIAADGVARLETRLPVSALAKHLRAQGHAARASHSCGRYLCNFLYYRSLERTERAGGEALFVHVPLTHAQGGPLSQDALLEAAQDTVTFVLEAATQAPRPRDVKRATDMSEVQQ